MDPLAIGIKYSKIAEWWNERHINSKYGIKQIEKALTFSKNSNTALDVGCGSGGRIIKLLNAHGLNVTGIDVSEKMIELARSNHPDTTFHQSDLLNFETGLNFDFIVAWDSIFHIEAAKQMDAINKMTNLLRPHGIIIYSFGDAIGDHEDLSFSENGKQLGQLDNDYFGYGSIGINTNLQALIDNGCKCLHLELDQYPQSHAYLIAQKQSGPQN